jgi:hypothetical protein
MKPQILSSPDLISKMLPESGPVYDLTAIDSWGNYQRPLSPGHAS